MIYTHSHIDHFGGVLGVIDADATVPIVAPQGFMDHAVSENVYAGTAMLRRGMYHAGTSLPISATGALGMGLGTGDPKIFAIIAGLTHQPDPAFAIVTP